MKRHLGILMIAFATAAFAQTAIAAWGDYDTTFGFLGAALDDIANHRPTAVAVQPDGKILVTGYRTLSTGRRRFFLRRYLSNGQVDTSFGSNGSAVSNALLNLNADYAGYRVLVQANGRIVVSGIGNGNPTIWRFFSSGSADTSIGNGGMRSLSAYGGNTPPVTTYANILYVGVAVDSTTPSIVLKFNSGGSQDMSFGTNGELITDAARSFSLGVDPTTGNLLVSGRRRSDPNDYGIERFLPTGALDPSFTHYGATYTGWTGSLPSQFVRLANGQFALNQRWINVAQGGGGLLGADLVRLSSSGNYTSRTTYEPTVFLNFLDYGCPDIIAQQGDGRLILKGTNSDEIFRFSTSFASVQTMSCANYEGFDNLTQAVLQSDDKMIAAGTYNGHIAIIRTLP
jgi:uncharacterized delta-60 repeat protein